MIKFKRRRLLIRPVPFTKLFPNVVTLIGLIVGVSSIRFALDSRWENAVYCVLAATIIDGLDGRVARFLNATSHFGAELDSLCDFINFGLCPAMLIYLWSFQQYEYKVTSWASIMLFIVCMAIRLARFNTSIVESSELKKKDDRFFVGIPAPSGAMLALIPMIIDFEISSHISDFSVRNHTLSINLYIVLLALMLPSRFPTISLKKIQIKPEYLSLTMIILSVIIITTVIYPWYVLPAAAILYILSIPICVYVLRKA
ncbi:MAG: phosphatidylcholine/phosphatidylserine synthase [Rickettsiaceae bacterium]